MRIPKIEVDQISSGNQPDFVTVGVYVDGVMKEKHHSIELHFETDYDEVIRMMEYFYKLGYNEAKNENI